VTRLRIQYREVCGFNSRLSHHSNDGPSRGKLKVKL
jgi:hypothetical protein